MLIKFVTSNENVQFVDFFSNMLPRIEKTVHSRERGFDMRWSSYTATRWPLAIVRVLNNNNNNEYDSIKKKRIRIETDGFQCAVMSIEFVCIRTKLHWTLCLFCEWRPNNNKHFYIMYLLCTRAKTITLLGGEVKRSETKAINKSSIALLNFCDWFHILSVAIDVCVCFFFPMKQR